MGGKGRVLSLSPGRAVRGEGKGKGTHLKGAKEAWQCPAHIIR